MPKVQGKVVGAIKISITSQPTEYRNVFGSVPPRSSSGSGWVVDLKQLLQCGIPFIGEQPDIPLAENDESLDRKLLSLNIPSTDGQFLVIVTNMHVVTGFNSGSYQIKGVAISYEAKVLVRFPARDLALILPDPASLEHLTPYQVSTEYIKQGDALIAYGYANGKEFCVSKGDLKRVMRKHYAYSAQGLLTYEMTSPTNPGDSGGPVLNSAGYVVAVTHQGTVGGTAQAQSHSIPIIELVSAARSFVAHGHDVVLSIPIETKNLLNPTMRSFYKANDDGLGVLVSDVSELYESPFRQGDILVRIQGMPIDADGMVKFGDTGDLVPYDSILEFFQLGANIAIQVIRDGVTIDLTVTLTTPLHSLSIVPTLPPEGAPHAFFRHGFGFIELHNKLGNAYTFEGRNQTPLSLFDALQAGARFKDPKHQGKCYVSIMSKFAEGYPDKGRLLYARAINGIPIRDIWHAQQILDHMDKKDPFVRVHCDGSKEPTFILPRLNEEQEQENRVLFSIPDRYHSLPQSELSKIQWTKLRDQFKQGFFKVPRVVNTEEAEDAQLGVELTA